MFFRVGDQLHKEILESSLYVSFSIHVGHAHFAEQAFENWLPYITHKYIHFKGALALCTQIMGVEYSEKC